jgi:hypothetical protein
MAGDTANFEHLSFERTDKMNKLTTILFALTTLVSCSAGLSHKPKQNIFLFKDKDGLYQYDPTTDKEKVIFKASDKQVFLDEPYQLSGDTLTFGIKGELVFVETSPTESGGERNFNEYYSVDLVTGKNWLSKKILYEVIGHTMINIKTLLFDINGKSNVLSDTTMIYKGSYTTSKGVVYNDFKPRFFSKATVGDKSVYSYRGSIYLTHQTDTTLLVEFKGNFDAKFGSGYFQPQLDPTGQYAVFRYLPGFMNFKENTSLQKVDLKTKKVSEVKEGDFDEPTFSNDGNFLLFSRNQKEGKVTLGLATFTFLT